MGKILEYSEEIEEQKYDPKAIDSYMTRAQGKDKDAADAQYKLGHYYHSQKHDNFEAFNWWKKAAVEHEHAESQFWLAKCYHKGWGIIKDDSETVKWYSKAANQGYPKAQCNLGNYYRNGWGVPKDESEALKWYKEAAEQGDSYAQCNLGNYYHNTGNDSEAFNCYKAAADQGDPYAQYRLGYCFHNGYGVNKSDSEAVEWWEKAVKTAERNIERALFYIGKCYCNLGIHYYNGWGVSKDESQALNWWRQAGEFDDMKAIFYLGKHYYNRSIVNDNNHQKAINYFERLTELYSDKQKQD